jgi:hypothetical protein
VLLIHMNRSHILSPIVNTKPHPSVSRFNTNLTGRIRLHFTRCLVGLDSRGFDILRAASSKQNNAKKTKRGCHKTTPISLLAICIYPGRPSSSFLVLLCILLLDPQTLLILFHSNATYINQSIKREPQAGPFKHWGIHDKQERGNADGDRVLLHLLPLPHDQRSCGGGDCLCLSRQSLLCPPICSEKKNGLGKFSSVVLITSSPNGPHAQAFLVFLMLYALCTLRIEAVQSWFTPDLDHRFVLFPLCACTSFGCLHLSLSDLSKETRL